jgi:crotonobetainyl-CoA:carnitine CoA-transferase CaiB-like acyl-CoA transferase
MSGPLAGIKIVDCSQIVSGPLAVMILADQGAEVIKVEPPGYGDLMRVGPFYRGGLSAFFANVNRGKRCIVLDLTKPKAREILLTLVGEADVFMQNWRPGAAERLGLGWEDLRKVNPRLIYCSVSGYGPTGPYSDRRVYDPIIQGITGHVAIQKNPDVPILDLVRNIVADKSTSWTAAQAITAALFARLRGTASGQHIQVPMIDSSLFFFWPDGMMKHTFVGEAERQLPVLYEVYRIYETADGHLIYFTASESEFFGLFRALGKPEWCADPRFATPQQRSKLENRELLGGMILEEIRKWPTRELIARMAAEQVPVGPVNSIEEMLVDPQVVHNEGWFEMEHPTAGKIRAPRPVARFSETPQEVRRMAPLHGEHTAEVLRELGFDDAGLAELRAEGVIP